MSIVDIVEMKRVRYLDELGNNVVIEEVKFSDSDYQEVLKKREELLEKLADFDEQIMLAVLEGIQIESAHVKKVIKKVLQ